ncbi:MAG: 3-beta hydroxysteroid dehydrogenase [Planctomycetaceae bacterium]|nr:3-beta hydroxysteroid dehydrogenase [Planctomycetaceae bacterium]
MTHRNILVTGGAGFIGSNVAVALKAKRPNARVTALDSLRRRGSELNLPRLRDAGVEFHHGDIRNPEDLSPPNEPYDLIVECSAEPSVLAGYDGNPRFVINTNLAGTVNCLELARVCRADFLFLSTSRVYPMARLNALDYRETETRFELSGLDGIPGAGPDGIAEDFPLHGARTLYGATKLASELLVEEYREMFGLRTVITRFGVVAGPWQMGKVDQGVFTLWVLAHHFGRPLKYIGYGGKGKQVRDLLHVADACDLLEAQLSQLDVLNGRVFNAGGGLGCSLSLFETTTLCQQIIGRKLPIDSIAETREGDIRVYVTDNQAVTTATGWTPKRTATEILADTHAWIASNETALRAVVG